MGKRSRHKRLNRTEAPRPPTPSASSASSRSPRQRVGAKEWFHRFLLATLVPGTLLCLIELVLRLAGYGHPTTFFLACEHRGYLTANPRFTWQFYAPATATTPTPLLVRAEKPAGTSRIVLLGESAAAGTPDPAYGFARILELLLRRQYPSNRFEVINVAVRGINSHVVRPIARECADLSPDLFIIYLGNNEVIGLHSPSPEGFNLTPYLRWLRLGQFVKTTRLGQLLQATMRQLATSAAPREQDMDYMRRQRLALDDPRRDAVYENFRRNLLDICETARGSWSGGTPVLLASMAVNLHDFPPLGSLHRRDLTSGKQADWEQAYAGGIAAETRGEWQDALKLYQAAEAIDDHYAELHFRQARCAEAAGDGAEARRHYRLARDWDALQFRSDSRLNGIIRSVATNAEPREASLSFISFADLEGSLDAAAEGGVPGRGLFQDHVHFTFAGDYEVARALAPLVAKSLRLGTASSPGPTQAECARALAFTSMDELNVRAAVTRQTARPPFLDQLDHAARQAEAERKVQEQLERTTKADFDQAAAVYREAIARDPEDWMFHLNYANLLSQFNQPAAAVAEYDFVMRKFPEQRAFHLAKGNALLQSGHALEAAAEFDAVLRTDPDFQPAREALAAARQKLR